MKLPKEVLEKGYSSFSSFHTLKFWEKWAITNNTPIYFSSNKISIVFISAENAKHLPRWEEDPCQIVLAKDTLDPSLEVIAFGSLSDLRILALSRCNFYRLPNPFCEDFSL